MVNVARIFSTLGNPNSLVPLAVKDFSATAGMTASSFVTGKEEGQDRFIDEVGTQIIWLFGIPGFKWLFDKTVFKAYGMDSEFDVRNLKDKDVFEKIKEFAPDENVKKSIEKIGKKQGLFKNVALYKFLVATSLTVGTYIGLTKAKQAYTARKIEKNLIKEYNEKKEQKENQENNNISAPTFKGIGDVVKTFAFSPVKNMWILDGAITAERLSDSRTEQEFIGYGIKEASTLCFMYYAGEKIQEYFEKRASEKYNKSIGLDARVIEDGSVKNAFESGSIKKSLEEYKKANTSDASLYEFLHRNPENEVVKTAKTSDIIKMYKNTNKIDTRKYIDLEEVRGTANKLEKLYEQFNSSIKKGESSEQFFKGVTKLKRHSILMNIGSCIVALGILTPLVMLAKRFSGKDNAEFKTKSEIREKLIKEGKIQAD